ncbi:MAG: MarR family transcriptional regulator [Lachnospiraceae bacterium]|nr:MarR family transcriptional regulator [Lachnospiraceae bacterium]
MELKKGLPIRPSEMGVLNIITATEGPHTPVILAEMLGVSKPMITAHITSLEGKGYINKEPSVKDKRAYYILPTEKARDLVESTKIVMNSQLQSMIDCLGQEEFDIFVSLADKVNILLEEKRRTKNGFE